MLGVRISNNPKRYLGLPTMMGGRKKHAFVGIKERFVKKDGKLECATFASRWEGCVYEVNLASHSYLYDVVFYVT